MNESLTKSIIVITASAIIFYIGRRFLNYGGDKDKSTTNRVKFLKPTIDEKDVTDDLTRNAFIALEAYIEAWNSGEDEKSLDELNNSLLIKFGVCVEKDDYVLFVKDKQGKKVLKYDKK